MTQCDKSKKRNRAFLVVGRLALIVSLWQAPIPWLHCHGTDLSQLASITSALKLSSHLTFFHPALASCHDDDLGWHFHWMLPCWSHPLGNSSDDETPFGETVTFDFVTTQPAESPFDSSAGGEPFSATLPTCSTHWTLRMTSGIINCHHGLYDRKSREKSFAIMRC